MAKPVIIANQSVLGSLQWQAFEFQPFALNNPTSWTVSPLPTGLSFSTTTGRISGNPTVPGVTDFGLIAINADGESDVGIFTIGIEPTSTRPPSTLLEAQWELATGKVTFPGLADGLLSRKRGDDFIVLLTITKAGVPADLALTSLKFRVKQEEDSPAVCASTGFRKSGTGTATAYLLHIAFTGSALAAALSDGEGTGDFKTPLAEFATRLAQFIGLGEFEMIETNPYRAGSPLLGSTTNRLSSQTFPIQLVRDIIADA